jgi:zinc protease
MMDSRIVKLGLMAALVLALTPPAPAQSGRGRGTLPPPKPAPKPTAPAVTVLGIPENGKLVRQDVDNVTGRYFLKNGLTVIIRERHASPLVSITVGVRAGAIHETDDSAGLSRLVRRMILKGSASRGGAAIDREVARLGGTLTSESALDHTSFNLIVPAESYQAAVELLADMLIKPAFNPDDLKKAAGEVLLESRRMQDRAAESAIERLYAAAFSVHPLRRGSAASGAALASMTREKALAFYQHSYQPQNIVVSIVGDIFSLRALGQIQLQFGNLAKAAASTAATGTGETNTNAGTKGVIGAVPPKASAPVATDQSAIALSRGPQSAIEEPAQDKLRYAYARADIGQSYVTIGYRTPAFKNDKDGLKEWATLQVLAAVLGEGKGSRLWQGLREGQASRDKVSVAFDLGVEFEPLPGAGLLVAQLRVDPGRIDRAEAEYIREIERFRREILSEGELQRARAFFEKRYYDTVSRYEKESGLIARYQLQFGDCRLFDSNLARIRAVTAQEVQQAAAKYLTLANTTVQELEPVKAPARTFTPEKFAELLVTFEARAAQPIRPDEVKPAVALKTFAQGAERVQGTEGQNITVAAVPLPIRDFSVLRGPRAYVREDKSLPLISVGVYFQGGRLVEDQTTSGTTELMLRSMLKSTTTRKGELIAQEIESYGGEVRIVNEPDFYGFTLDVLSRNAENAVRLLLEVIENPFFDKTEVARERDGLLADQLWSRDDAPSRAVELMWGSIYPAAAGGAAHPYGLPRYGMADVVKALTDEKLEAWHGRSIKRQLPAVVLVGDTDGSALVSRIFSEGLKRGELDKTIKANLPGLFTTPETLAEQRARGAAAQVLGYRIPGLPPDKQGDYLALAMIANLASTGRLMEELRDKQGLTDGALVAFEQRLASGAFVAQFDTLPENEGKARDVLLAALQAMAATPATDDEFEQGRNATIGRYSIALQDHPSRTAEYARAILFGRKPSDVEAQPDLIRTVRKTDLKRVAESLLKGGQPGRGVVRGTAAQSGN